MDACSHHRVTAYFEIICFDWKSLWKKSSEIQNWNTRGVARARAMTDVFRKLRQLLHALRSIELWHCYLFTFIHPAFIEDLITIWRWKYTNLRWIRIKHGFFFPVDLFHCFSLLSHSPPVFVHLLIIFTTILLLYYSTILLCFIL